MPATFIANFKTKSIVGKASVHHCEFVRKIGFATIMLLIVLGAKSFVWAAEAQCPPTPNYTPDFSSNGTCLAQNGNAMLVSVGSTALQITTSAGNQTGSAWYITPQTVQNGFTTTFQFQFTNPSPFLPMESPSSFRIPAREQSVSPVETEARSDTVTPIRMPIPARETAYRTVWRSNSIRLKTAGIRKPSTAPSAMWRFRVAVPARIRRTMDFYARDRVVQTRLWAAPLLLRT